MSVSDVIQIISTVGFPIVCCGVMGWFFKYVTDKERDERNALNEQHRQEIAQINEQHKSDMLDVTQALNNNTLAIQKLCDKLDSN